jgi:4-hydroxy-tetrahydrodipicolinate synthase
MKKLKGVGVALVTPFNKNLEIDFVAYKKVLEHTTQIGVNYWVVQGTTGESPTTSVGEKKQLLQFTKEHNPQNLPILYGMGGNYTAEILENIKNADLKGVTAILSVSPYYNKPTQKGLVAHYQAIADASPVPVVLYNVPGRTASNISAEVTLELAEHQNIIATKEASGNLVQCMEIMRNKPKDFMLISGDDMMTVPMIAFGAEGVISVMANAYQKFNQMVQLALSGNFLEASALLFQLLESNDLMYLEGNPVGVKKALEILKVCESYVRMPLIPASEDLSKKIEIQIEKLK